jgi:hypothetical protein
MGALIMVAAFIAFFIYLFKAINAAKRKAVDGPVEAKAAYAKILREHPNSPDASISEAEYVQKHLKNMPSFGTYFVRAIVIGIVGIPGGCMLQLASIN